MKINNICCLGKDLLGRTMCLAIAFKCPEIRVMIVDDEKNVSKLNANVLQCFGPRLVDILKKCCHRNFFFTSLYEEAIKEADLIILSVKVPVINLTNISFKELDEVTKLIAIFSVSYKIIVDISDVSFKAAERVSSTLKALARSGFEFNVLSVPCFINEDSTVEQIINPERIVIGCKGNPLGRVAAQSLYELYERWIPRKNILIVNYCSAGLYKSASSLFLAQKEIFLYSIMTICERTGADFSKILSVLDIDSVLGNNYLSQPVVFENLKSDITSVVSTCDALDFNESSAFWEGLINLNDSFTQQFFEKVKTVLGSLQGKDIAFWGSLKMRRSAAVVICNKLVSEKVNLRIHDTELQAKQIQCVIGNNEADIKKLVKVFTDIYASVNDASALILCSQKNKFGEINFSELKTRMKEPIVFDRYTLFEKDDLRKFGVEYHAFCF